MHMKILRSMILIIITNLTLVCNAQITVFDDDTNLFIIEFLKEKKIENDFVTDPLYLLDGKPIMFENISELSDLNFKEIIGINTMSKNSGIGEAIWGDFAKEGVMIIKTNKVIYPEMPSNDDCDILFMLDNKIISKEQAIALDAPKDIQTVTIYKSSIRYQLLDGDGYHGIIVMVSKK